MEQNNVTIEDLAVMVKKGFNSVDKRFDGVEQRLSKIEATMVTKSYLDDKLADLEGSVITRQRKEDHKVNLLIDLLRSKSVLAESDVQTLREIQVFPPAL